MAKPAQRKRLPAHTPDRVRKFIDRVLAGDTPTGAAIAAGFSPTQAGALCGRPEVRIALERERVARDQVVTHTPSRIESALGFTAFADPGRMFRPDGSLLPIAEMAPEIRAAIASFEHHTLLGPAGLEHRVSKIRLASKEPVLKDLALMHHLLGPEISMVNSPAFNITINCGESDDDESDRQPAVEAPRRYVADDTALPAPASFDHGGALALARGSIAVADEPAGPSTPPAQSPPSRRPSQLELLREKASAARARSEAARQRHDAEEAAESTARGSRESRRPRSDRAILD